MKQGRVNDAARCPACLGKLDGFTDPFAAASPSAGDLSVCVYCAVLLTFNTDLTLRLLRDDEHAALPAEERNSLEVARWVVGRSSLASRGAQR